MRGPISYILLPVTETSNSSIRKKKKRERWKPTLTQHAVLTGTYPEPHPGTSSLAGTTHSLPLSTSYYKAEVPIWIDLVASPSEWATSFTSPEAKEVLDVLGGVVVIFSVSGAENSSSSSINTSHVSASDTGEHAPPTSPTELIREMGRVMGALGGWDWNGVGLGIGIGGSSGTADMFDDACAAIGLEFVHAATASGKEGEKNEFGGKGPSLFCSMLML